MENVPKKKPTLNELPKDTLDEIRALNIYKNALLDDKFLLAKWNEEQISFLRMLSNYEIYKKNIGHPSFINKLVEKKVLSKEIFQNIILSIGSSQDVSALIRLLCPEDRLEDNLYLLVDYGIINTSVFLRLIRKSSNNMAEALFNILNSVSYERLKLVLDKIFRKGAGNILDFGADLPEFERQLEKILWYSPRELSNETHNIIVKAGSEDPQGKITKQIEEVLQGKETGRFFEDIKTVFSEYIKLSKNAKKVIEAGAYPENKRKENIQLVNKNQEKLLEKMDSEMFNSINRSLYNPEDRYFDIYVRYVHGNMDPFALSIISQAANWYIENGYSRLFNKIRIIPNKPIHGFNENQLTPWVAKAGAPKAQILQVKGKLFRNSLLGANRIFLTHSNAREASEMFSIPIVSQSVLANQNKLPRKGNYVIFDADFDKDDFGRYETPLQSIKTKMRKFFKGDGEQNIRVLIDETIRTLQEVEEREIKRTQETIFANS